METAPPWQAIASRGHLAVLLVRHGQTTWNDQRRFLGITDIPLDHVGRAQAAELSTALRGTVDHVVSSPLARAHETATALHPQPRVIEALRELDQGALEGMKAAAAFQQFPDFFAGWAQDPGSVTPPGGECLLDCQERVLRTLDGLAGEHRGGSVVGVFSHQLAIASALCGLIGKPLAHWQDLRLGNCAISVLEFDGQTWRIEEHGWSVGNLGITSGS